MSSEGVNKLGNLVDSGNDIANMLNILRDPNASLLDASGAVIAIVNDGVSVFADYMPDLAVPKY